MSKAAGSTVSGWLKLVHVCPFGFTDRLITFRADTTFTFGYGVPFLSHGILSSLVFL